MFQESKDLAATPQQHPCLENWRRRVVNAEKRGCFTYQEIQNSRDWNLCAVGDARTWYGKEVIPYREVSYPTIIQPVALGPIDTILRSLGLQFYHMVRDNDFSGCIKTLDAIESYLQTGTINGHKP